MRYLGMVLLPLLVACSQQPQVQPVSCQDLLAGCQLGTAAAPVVIRVDHAPRSMQKFRLTVDAASASNISADLSMLNMDMGPNRYTLVKNGQQFYADMMLPMCVSGRSDWVLTLTIDGKPLVAQFSTQGAKR